MLVTLKILCYKEKWRLVSSLNHGFFGLVLFFVCLFACGFWPFVFVLGGGVFCKFKSTKSLFCSNKVGGILYTSWFHTSEAKQHNLICLSCQPHKHLYLHSALSLGAVCTFSSEHLHPAITESGKHCKWNTIHGGRSLAKASESTHAAQIFAGRRYYKAEEATKLEHHMESPESSPNCCLLMTGSWHAL